MTYYADLTNYEFLDDDSTARALNIGWLSNQKPYTKGETLPEFHIRLLQFCNCFVNPTRGWHDCEFCPPQPFDPQVGNRLKPFGGAEIRVFYQGKIYAAPNLIHHYVTVHNYKPPVEFIEAVLTGLLPGTSEYETLIQHLGVDYWLNKDALQS